MLLPAGGVDYSLTFQEPSLVYRAARAVTSLIYAFHMPAFMALSGVLFYASFQNGKYKTLGMLACEKSKRLLIPFLAVGCLYAFPLKYLSGFYSGSQDLLHDFILGQVLIRDDTHLWYLLTLFMVFVIIFLLERYLPGHMARKLTTMFFLFAVNRLLSWRWQSPMEMTLWFYVGYCFAAGHRTVSREKVPGALFISSVLFIGVAALQKWLDIPVLEKTILEPGAILSGSYAAYLVSVCLSGTRLKDSRLFKLLLRDSFGIYLYSDPLNYPILYLSVSTFGNRVFTENVMSGGLYIFRILFTFCAALVMTEAMRKARIKYLY